ncbi:MAG: hypothetical protein HY820_24220 [Acidobacteria bacterium]|nr:hypothetical protein [Acidobacteriota bacterium]
MTFEKRSLGLAVLSWALAFAVSFLLFPIKASNAPLFDAVMNLVVLLVAGVVMRLYFRWKPVSISSAIQFGLTCLAANLILDYPMFAYGPMKMTAGQYYSEIGIAYLIYPIFGWWASRMGR